MNYKSKDEEADGLGRDLYRFDMSDENKEEFSKLDIDDTIRVLDISQPLKQQDTINHQREAILRFYAIMCNRDYQDVVDEYLGKPNGSRVIINRLYPTLETAIHWMNEQESK